jgi:hypothetical protein
VTVGLELFQLPKRKAINIFLITNRASPVRNS